MRARRSCLSVPGSSPKFLAKAAGLPADEVFFDLEDSVAPLEKEAARGNIIEALKNNTFQAPTKIVRINGVYTRWAYRDIIEIVEAAGDLIDGLMIPKVETPNDVTFVADLLRMIEDTTGLNKKLGLEVQIETALGLQNIREIAAASDRIEDLILGPADMSASLGLPTVTAGAPIPGYENLDHWHYVLTHINIAARARNLQAIDGPYLLIRDLDGFRGAAMRARALGYDGKWALHPDQVQILNEVFTPTQEEYDKAEAILEHYKYVTEIERKGAVMFGKEMIDEASRKMAEQVAARGKAAGMKREKGVEDFLENGMTHTVSIVLNIAADKADEFERAFEEHEVPIWQDLHQKGTLLRASLSPLEISTVESGESKQYLVLAQFARADGHHAHDNDPRFKRWNKMADQYQPEEPFVFGGDSIYEVGG